jgi:Pyridoxamine 5'-phosphate oxidase
MMSVHGESMTVLSDDESWHLLAGMALGRLVSCLEGQPAIFPVNFVVQRRTVLFRTSEGAKLFSAVMNNRVAFEADDHNVSEGWSVIATGRARVLYYHRRGGRSGTSASPAVDGDAEASLRSRVAVRNQWPPFPIRIRTRP